MSPIDVVGGLCAAIAVVSIVYWCLSDAWLHLFFRDSTSCEAEADAVTAFPAITFFRPLKPGVLDLRPKLAAFIEEMREDDQVLLGVEPGTGEARLCAELAQAFPTRDLRVIECGRGAALNPKVAKLLQMTPAVRHEHWIVLDSEFVAEPGWLERFRREWALSGKDAFTAGYRFTGISTFLQALDALPILVTLWPGLGAVVRGGRLNFMLGAVIAVRRRDLEEVGGWQRFSGDLAEDNRLGTALARAGKSVGLSRNIATLSSDPLDWRAYWRHQRRVAVTYRVCNPAGFTGMICTHGVPFAAAVVLLRPTASAAWLLLGATLACRWWTARRLCTLLRFPVPHLFYSVIVANFVETTCWVAAWFSTTVWWAGKRWNVRNDGLLVDEAGRQDRSALA